MMKAAGVLAACAAALSVYGCEKFEVDPNSGPRAVLVSHYGEEVVVQSYVADDGVVCGYASVPEVFSDFAFLIEGDRLVLFSEDPQSFARCSAEFVAPRIAAPVID